MTHIMRKHGKIIMAVLTVGLMIVWGVQSNLQKPDTRGTIERGTLNGKRLLNQDLAQSAYEIQIMTRFPVAQYRMPNAEPITIMLGDEFGALAILSRDETDRVIHWYLLLKEAERYGITASENDILEFIRRLSLTNEDMEKRLAMAGASQRSLHEAIRHALMIDRLAVLAMRAPEVSLPQVELDAERTMSKVDIAVASIDGARDWQKSPEPASDQLAKQFDTYKDNQPGVVRKTPDGHTYTFGYRYPDRVKIEYLRFDRAELLKQYKVTEADYDAAYRYYKEHPEEFKRTEAAPKSPVIGPATVPATQAATRPVNKSFAEVKEELAARQVAERVNKVMKKIVEQAQRLAAEPWKAAELEEGYKKPVPRDKWTSYTAIVDELGKSREYAGFRPSYQTRTGFLTEADLKKLPGIGESLALLPSKKTAPFATLATHVRELSPPKDTLASSFLQVGVEGPILTDEAGNVYLYRVTEAEKTHEPASLDEVRPQVIEDLKKIASYERARDQAAKLAAEARGGALEALAKSRSLESENLRGLTRRSDAREFGKLPYSQDLVDAIFAMTRDPAATQPVTRDNKRVSPTTTFNNDEKLIAYAIELVSYRPVGPSDFAVGRWKQVQDSERAEGAVFARTWLSLPVLADRLHFVPAETFGKKERNAEE